jgi:NAD(P)-dependent dehydrogenase (short-subunit alcohol dehydrogenase family)
MDLKLTGKTALVTGSTAGIGFAIAKLLAAEGAKVVINGRTAARVSAAINEIKSEHAQANLLPFAADLSQQEGINKLIQEFPAVDILINNLGIYQMKPFAELSDAEWLHMFDVNVMSGVRLSRHYLPGMLAKNWGRIIFISSESGLQIPPEMIHYGMTKTAQLAIARGLAETTVGTNVTVNSVLPGPTRSEGVEQFINSMAKERNIDAAQIEKEFFTQVRPSSLLKRFTTSEEVANMVAYVCSPLSAGTNGASIRVDGGVIRSIG